MYIFAQLFIQKDKKMEKVENVLGYSFLVLGGCCLFAAIIGHSQHWFTFAVCLIMGLVCIFNEKPKVS
jgi:phosphatidylglycerophosphate synthase